MKILRSKSFIVVSLMLAATLSGLLVFRQTAVSATPRTAVAPLVSMTQAEVKSLPLTLTTQGHIVSLNEVDIHRYS